MGARWPNHKNTARRAHRPDPATIRHLAELIDSVDVTGRQHGEDRRTQPTTDQCPPPPRRSLPLRMLAPGVLHEWFGVADAGPPEARTQTRSPWTPPLLILTHLARQGLDRTGDGHHVVWIGRRVWAHPRVLVPSENGPADDRRLLARSVFVDPPDDAARLWAIDVALRCSSVAVVIADGSGLGMAHTRRIQLTARRTQILALTARPPMEMSTLSAASLRWRVERVAVRRPHLRRHLQQQRGEPPGDLPDVIAPRWRIELLRCKGMQRAERAMEAARMESPLIKQWMLEWDRASGCVRVPADVVDRSDSAALPERAANDEHRRTG